MGDRAGKEGLGPREGRDPNKGLGDWRLQSEKKNSILSALLVTVSGVKLT